MRILSQRRPELLFLVSMLILACALIVRARQPVSQVAIDTAGSAPAPVSLSTEEMISRLQAQLKDDPENSAAYAQLGLALLQRVRETGDPQLYTQAATALDAALKRNPNELDAVIGEGSLALSLHHFSDALRWGNQAHSINPYRAEIYGIIGDAQLELGQYDAADATFQKMVNTRPDLSSYSRISYLREIYGESDAAISAMQMAVQAGGPATENTLWTQYQLGMLYFNRGDLVNAERAYRQALQVNPDYAYALSGLAGVRAAQGSYPEAIAMYQQAINRLPLPAFVISLCDLYQVTGDSTNAKAQSDLLHAMEQLAASTGVDVDMELALFDADHGADPGQTVLRARSAYSHRPSIYAADVLAWSLYQAQQYSEARHYSQLALRLGTRDALLHFHAGMIARALADTTTSRSELTQALQVNPFFSLRYSRMARETLDQEARSAP